MSEYKSLATPPCTLNCLNGGMCVVDTNGISYCQCLDIWTGSNCSSKKENFVYYSSPTAILQDHYQSIPRIARLQPQVSHMRLQRKEASYEICRTLSYDNAFLLYEESYEASYEVSYDMSIGSTHTEHTLNNILAFVPCAYFQDNQNYSCLNGGTGFSNVM